MSGETAGSSAYSLLTSGEQEGDVEFEHPTRLPRALQALANDAVVNTGTGLTSGRAESRHR